MKISSVQFLLVIIFPAYITEFCLSRGATYDVFAKENCSTGGTPLSTINLSVGDLFKVSVNPLDLWSAGGLPRWSNANGLLGPLFAGTNSESGELAGTQIGQDWGLWLQDGFTAPSGALVGRIEKNYFFLGTSYSGFASNSGVLELMYWDSQESDNSEKIMVRVETIPLMLHVEQIGTNVLVSWPSVNNVVMDSTLSLSPPLEWSLAKEEIAVADERYVVTNAIDQHARFFRLRRL